MTSPPPAPPPAPAPTPAARRGARSAWFWGAFGGAFAFNTLAFAALTPIGWALRGSAYEAGRPTAEDLWLARAMQGVFALAALVHVGGPLACLLGRRAWGALGVAASWLLLPLSYAAGVALLAAAAAALR